MTNVVYFRVDALEDAEQAQKWYESRREGLGQRFAQKVMQAADRIEQWPLARAIIWQEIRAYKIDGFPYVVYYRVMQNYIEIIAVLHGARDEVAWRTRVIE